MFFDQNQDNQNTILHEAVLNATSLDDFMTRFADLSIRTGSSDIQKMAGMRNANGKIPIELVNTTKLNRYTRTAMIGMLLNITNGVYSLQKLSDRIDENTLLSRDPELSPQSMLYTHLKIACDIINKTRAIVSESSTHPQLNACPAHKVTEVIDKINLLRTELPEEKTPLIDQFLFYLLMNPLAVVLNPQDAFHKKCAGIVSQHKVGNCNEITSVAYSILRRDYPSVRGEPFKIAKGDHVFLVLGHEENAVVCDPWIGDAYPLSEINNRLKDCKYVFLPDGTQRNCVIDFDSKKQYITPKKIDPHLRSFGITIAVVCGVIGLFILWKIASVINMETEESLEIPACGI